MAREAGGHDLRGRLGARLVARRQGRGLILRGAPPRPSPGLHYGYYCAVYVCLLPPGFTALASENAALLWIKNDLGTVLRSNTTRGIIAWI